MTLSKKFPMSKSPRGSQPLSSLSAGNVVSAALRIYRDRFKQYYRLAFFAYCWVIVPVYGWAKFSAISALISRLAFNEVIERPEVVEDIRSQVEARKWSFLGAGILAGLIFLGVMLGAGIVFGIVTAVIGGIFGRSPIGVAVVTLVSLIGVIALLLGVLWLSSRLLIIEVPLAIEDNLTASSAINRSWQLTAGYVWRLIGVVSVGFLITLPISIVIQIATGILQVIVGIVFPPRSALFNLVYIPLSLLLSFASGAILIPFWQSIKAVIYYDLRTRKEGMGLDIGRQDW